MKNKNRLSTDAYGNSIPDVSLVKTKGAAAGGNRIHHHPKHTSNDLEAMASFSNPNRHQRRAISKTKTIIR